MSHASTAPVVLNTGALAGIGRATALAFAREGARLVVSGRSEEAGNALAAEIEALGAEALFLRADVRHEAEVRSLVDQTLERFGRLDAAVNNAGTEGQPGPVTDQTAETYAATFDTNVLGVLLSMKHELRAMTAQGSGSIVNVSSAYGKVGAAGASVYVASKHAVEGLTKSAALEVATTGIRVNAVAPGPFPTESAWEKLAPIPKANVGAASADEVPMGRFGRMPELCNLLTFLQADGCEYLTGVNIAIDGGHHLAAPSTFAALGKLTPEDWAEAKALVRGRAEQEKAQRSAG